MLSAEDFDEFAKQAIRDLIDSNIRKGKLNFEVHSLYFQLDCVEKSILHSVLNEYEELGWSPVYTPSIKGNFHINSGYDRVTLSRKKIERT